MLTDGATRALNADAKLILSDKGESDLEYYFPFEYVENPEFLAQATENQMRRRNENMKNLFDRRIYVMELPVNEDDEVIGKVDKLLINATDIDFDQVAGLMEQFHGIMIPAHLDKSTTSLLSNLGFIPPDSTFGIAEIKDLKNLHRLQDAHPYLKDCMIVSDSDAHYLPDIHEPTYTMLVPELSVSGVFAALRAAAKRK